MNDVLARRVFLAVIGLLFAIGLSTGAVSQSFANVLSGASDKEPHVATTVRLYAGLTVKSSATAAQSLSDIDADLARSNAKLTHLTTDTQQDSSE